ncbi:Shedu immune nuclease family protein [Vibrio splendidus]
MYWWVNHHLSYKDEVSGGYLWTPKTLRNGRPHFSFDLMTKLSVGDVIFSYSDRQIKAIGTVKSSHTEANRPASSDLSFSSQQSGWLVRVGWEKLDNPFFPKEYIEDIAPILPSKRSPLRNNGMANQIYLTEISDNLANFITDTLKLHQDALEKAVMSTASFDVKYKELSNLSLQGALRVWKENEKNSNEEFWHNLFESNPKLLEFLLPSGINILQSKCYVGGKSIRNKGGNIVDFLYASTQTKNAVLIEIKTPTTQLIGKKYRANAYCIHEDLSGSIVQVLNYKNQLIRDYNSLVSHDEEDFFNVFDPECIVLVGSLDSLKSSDIKAKSFKLFERSISDVRVVTYDELFNKISSFLDMEI